MKLMGVEELASMLDVSPFTVRYWVSQRSIPYIKFGKRLKFHKDEIERWLNSKKVGVINAHI